MNYCYRCKHGDFRDITDEMVCLRKVHDSPVYGVIWATCQSVRDRLGPQNDCPDWEENRG